MKTMRGNSLGGFSNFGGQTAIKCSGALVLSDKRANLAPSPVGKATQLFAGQSLEASTFRMRAYSGCLLELRDHTALTARDLSKR